MVLATLLAKAISLAIALLALRITESRSNAALTDHEQMFLVSLAFSRRGG